ncbi:unnamed protein product [Protopolystoma xenopodis]|uniref:Proteasome assembly chaperone 1 n=1 Tax=Protopolystoma xenopodis TaxID=117903 RepID=A0A3S5BWA3_9PLAT|nr:unnamed protein product [Protopolystoma xenopodis]
MTSNMANDRSFTPVYRLLEPPNTIIGLPADVLTYCQLKRIHGVLYAIYHSSNANTLTAYAFAKQVIKHLTPITTQLNLDLCESNWEDLPIADRRLCASAVMGYKPYREDQMFT